MLESMFTLSCCKTVFYVWWWVRLWLTYCNFHMKLIVGFGILELLFLRWNWNAVIDVMEFIPSLVGTHQWHGELADLCCDLSFYISQQGCLYKLWHIIMWQVSGILHKCHTAGIVNGRGTHIFWKSIYEGDS